MRMLTTYPFDPTLCDYCNGSQLLFNNPAYGPCLCDVPEYLRGIMTETKRRGRKPMTEEEKAAKEAAKAGKLALVGALEFCAAATLEKGETFATHAAIGNKWLTTYDGITMLGTPIEEEFTCYPNFSQFRRALERAGDKLKMTYTGASANARLQISGGRFRVTVPCEPDPAQIMRPQPEQPQYPVTEAFIGALSLLVPITSENQDDVTFTSVLCKNGACVATDACIIVEKQHDTYFANEFALPRAFIKVLQKIKKEPKWYGLSETGLTIWYDDNSFARGKLYDRTQWSRHDNVWPQDYSIFSWHELPSGFYSAVADAAPFANEHGCVVFDEDAVKTHDVADVGAVITHKGIRRSERFYSIKRLMKFEGLISHVDYWSDNRGLLVGYGDKCRGLLASHQDRADAAPDVVGQAELEATGSVAAGFAAYVAAHDAQHAPEPEPAQPPQDEPQAPAAPEPAPAAAPGWGVPPAADLAALAPDAEWQPPPINLGQREASDVINGAEPGNLNQFLADAIGDESDEDEEGDEAEIIELEDEEPTTNGHATAQASNGSSPDVLRDNIAPKGYDWQRYYDETNGWFVNGTEWARAGYQADANPAPSGSDEYRYWYEGWRSVGSPRT